MSTITLDSDDEEIIEIFVEEADEVLQDIDRHLKTLRSHHKDQVALREVRRAFHTLKGSGRMAKALDIGELAWKMENMLNRAIEGKIQVSEPMLDLLDTCYATMPTLVKAFKHHREHQLSADLETIMTQADALASGQQSASARRPSPASAPAGDLSGIETRLNDMQRLVEQAARRSDEALHRAEMGLQQARGLGSQIEGLASGLKDRRSGSEIRPLVERVNVLARDILELRELTSAPRPESAPPTKEIQHLVDQRVRERLAASERAKLELEHKLQESLQAASSARLLGLWALIIAILTLAGAIGGAAFLLL